MFATLRAKNQVTLPLSIIKKLKLQEKAELDIEMNDNGQIVITPVQLVNKKFVNDLKEALEDVKNGRVSEAMSAEELIEKLGL